MKAFKKYKVWEYLSKLITNWAKLQNQTVHYSVHYDVWQCNVPEYNVAITKLFNAIVPTLKELFLSCFTFDRVPEFLFLVRVIVYVSSLVFVFFVLTQSKSATDSIKELLSRKEMISSLSFLHVICNKKEMEC